MTPRGRVTLIRSELAASATSPVLRGSPLLELLLQLKQHSLEK